MIRTPGICVWFRNVSVILLVSGIESLDLWVRCQQINCNSLLKFKGKMHFIVRRILFPLSLWMWTNTFRASVSSHPRAEVTWRRQSQENHVERSHRPKCSVPSGHDTSVLSMCMFGSMFSQGLKQNPHTDSISFPQWTLSFYGRCQLFYLPWSLQLQQNFWAVRTSIHCAIVGELSPGGELVWLWTLPHEFFSSLRS